MENSCNISEKENVELEISKNYELEQICDNLDHNEKESQTNKIVGVTADFSSDQKDVPNSQYLEMLFVVNKENKHLTNKISLLEQDVARLETDKSKEFYIIEVESLKKVISQQKLDINRFQDSIRQQTEATEKQIQQANEESDRKVAKLAKQLEHVSKERDAMVMKYAVSENSAINLQRIIKNLETKVRECAKEKECLNEKVNVAAAEKVKLALIIEGKSTEILEVERELQKKKDELHAQSSNLKFFQNKLKIELEGHKETQTKLEKLNQKLREANEEKEQVRKDGQEILRKYETEGRKVLEMQDTAELTSLQDELESLKEKHDHLLATNNKLCQTVQTLETERRGYEETLSKAREVYSDFQETLADLETSRSEVESLRHLLSREEDSVRSCQDNIDRLRESNAELQQEINVCRGRESELLSFTRILTEKNVTVQSELSALETRLQQLQIDASAAERQSEILASENDFLKCELNRDRQQRTEEKQMMARHLHEKTETAELLSQQLQDMIGENQLLRKKHLSSIKELSREVQALKRKGEMADCMSISQGSRTSSTTSLNNIDSDNRTLPPPPAANSQLEPPGPDRQLLIEKIVKVQRSNARKQEKIEFLEEHSRQLVMELQKKSKIIQSLVMKHQPGALVSSIMDDNKTALSKHGGIMASVYTSKPMDESITLELSLDINRKLQAVLEDTILKNITLKENMETLGNEIARLVSLQESS